MSGGGIGLTLREAAPADARALAALGERGFVAKFGHMYRADDLAGFLAAHHAEAPVAVEIADPAMRVQLAELDGTLAGFCKLVLACGWPEHARGRVAVELKQLYVAPDLLGGGIGAALTAWALAEAAALGADEVQLSVWSGNTDAQRFYARHGFAHVADTEFWVGAQRDEEFLYARMLGW